VRAALDRGATKTALALAKQLAKAVPGPESDALLEEAYRARVDGLQAAGLESEAAELIRQATVRFDGDGRAAFSEQSAALAVRTGRMSALLAELNEPTLPDTRRRALEAAIETHLVDPRTIAGAPELAPDHPLRRAAIAVSRALTEAAGGALDEEARTGLARVGRRSPLAPWRAFVRALDAFHREDDDAMRAALGRIPETASVARAGRILEALADGRFPDLDGSGSAVRTLVRSVAGGASTLGPDVARAADAAEGGDVGRFMAAMTRVFPEVGASNPLAACRLYRWLMQGVDHPPLDDAAMRRVVQRSLPRGEETRLLALAAEDVEPESGLVLWSHWLTRRLEKDAADRPADLELALLLDHLAALSAETLAGLETGLEELGLALQDVDQRPAHVLRELLGDAEYEDFAAGPPRDFAVLTTLLDLSAALKNAFGARIRIASYPDDLIALALRLDPIPERFERRYRMFAEDGGSPRDLEALLEQWAARHPSRVEPLLHLAREALGRNALRKAEGFVDRALDVDSLSAEVREVEFHIRIANLMRHLKAGNLRLVRKDLDRLEGTPAAATPERKGFLAAVRHLVATADGDSDSQDLWRAAVASSVGDRGAELYLTRVRALAPPAGSSRRSDKVPVNYASRRNHLAALATQVRLCLALNWPIHDAELPARLASQARPEELPDDLQDLDALCRLADSEQEEDLLHLVSGKGLLTNGPLLPRFLMFRWQALDRAKPESEAAGECRRLAVFHAAQRNDVRTLKEIRAHGAFSSFLSPWLKSIFGETDPVQDLLDPVEARALLERERQLQGRIADRRRLLAKRRPATTKRPSRDPVPPPTEPRSRKRRTKRQKEPHGAGVPPDESRFTQHLLPFLDGEDQEDAS